MLYSKENVLKILDYNIRCCHDGEGRMVGDRAPRLFRLIEETEPDIIALQEGSWRWTPLLEENLYRKYAMRYCYRLRNSRESTPLLWRRDKFDLLDEGHFWLSETPDTPSFGFGQTQYARVCTWVKLRVKATGKEFFYFCTHMNGDDASTVGSGNVIMQYAEAMGAFTECGALLSGDFNLRPHTPGYENLNNSGKLRDVNEALGFDPSTTVHGYYGDKADDGAIIDYVFYSPDFMEPLRYEVINKEYFGGYISDHKGLWVEVALRGE